MCGRYNLSSPPALIATLFKLAEAPALRPRWNIAPTQQAPVIRSVRADDGTTGRRRLDMLRWGLVPRWADDPAIGNSMINARAETAAKKPAFRWAFQHHRCLVPADGFFEWKAVPGSKRKQPYNIRRQDGHPFAMAGLWERWSKEGQDPIESFTILTVSPNAAVKELHDRMPLILDESSYDLWLDRTVEEPEKLAALFKPCPDDWLTAYPVSTLVNSPKNDAPECVAPVQAEGLWG
jgi:putative SOS response-associated peptidase YedK